MTGRMFFFRHRLVFSISILCCLGLLALARSSLSIPAFLIYGVALLPIMLLYRSSAYAAESFMIPLVWVCFFPSGAETVPERTIMYLPLAMVLLVGGANPLPVRFSLCIVIPVASMWGYSVADALLSKFSLLSIAVTGSAAATLFIYFSTIHSRKHPLPRTIDLILCSYTGNTGRLAQFFTNGAEKAGAKVVTHRFHYYNDFDAPFTGDALAVAFPVIGWKPPWPLFEYLLFRMPRGKGRQAFILYSAAGGPENAGVLVWLILTLRGYRVAGRHWCIYPMNVPTFRLGPRRLWRFLDRIVPCRKYDEEAMLAGEAFARNESAGIPFIVWPFPLIIIGFALDNKWLNTWLYHTYAWRSRCDGCGLCAAYCPAQRIVMADNKPRAHGTCALCMGCVNLCPKNAMHMACFTEYGRQYKPRWPEFVARGRDDPD